MLVKCTKLSPHCYSAPPETRNWKTKVKEYCVNVVLRIEFNKHDPSIQVQDKNLDSNAAVFSSLRDLFCMEYCKTGCIHRQTEWVNRQSKYVRGFQHFIHCCLELNFGFLYCLKKCHENPNLGPEKRRFSLEQSSPIWDEKKIGVQGSKFFTFFEIFPKIIESWQ